MIDSFYLRLSNQCIFVWAIPNCLRFIKMCLCQVSHLSFCQGDIFWLGELNLVYVYLGTRFTMFGECDVNGFRLIGFHSPFLDCNLRASSRGWIIVYG
jgi:hypothetical protein